MIDQLDERIRKEKEVYNKGLVMSERYRSILNSVNKSYSRERAKRLIREMIKTSKDKCVLEIGSESWASWIDFNNYPPEKLVCINISEAELQNGILKSKERELIDNIDFIIMDAHHLSFPDLSFDVVYGGSILHHLDIETAIKEIYRVLKPGGEIIFIEPLIYNLVAKIVRILTPDARTPDEKPLGIKELTLINKYFDTRYYFYQFLEPFFSMLSYFLFNNPQNKVTEVVDKLDSFLQRLSFFKYLYRGTIIYGTKRMPTVG